MTGVVDPVHDQNAGQAEPEALRRRILELEAALERAHDEHRIEVEHERLRHHEHALGLIIEGEAARDRNRLLAKRGGRLREKLAETERSLAAARRREQDLRDELERVYASRTWRAGQALASGARGRRR